LKVPIKLLLYKKCIDYADHRIAAIQSAIEEAVESANDDNKSSSGDKHETGRAMAQLEQEKGSKLLSEALEFKSVLQKINPEQKSDKILLGSLVYTNKGTFYIAVAAGKIMIEDDVFFAISQVSPIALKLIGLSQSDNLIFNGNNYKIIEIV
jgi:transcription elongation GreA/GreB family factor